MIEKYIPDAVIGTIETGGESALAPAAGVSAVAPVAASVDGGNRFHHFWPEEQRVEGQSFKISAILLFVVEITHAGENLHVFLGPRDFTSYGNSYARLCWTGFGFRADIVEKYVLLSGSMHVAVALKGTGRSR